MKLNLPLLVTSIAFTIMTFVGLRIRPYIYSSGQAPYRDLGFTLTPDLSITPNFLLGYNLLYVCLIALFAVFMVRGMTVLRRLLFILAIAQGIQTLQCFTTVFPEPNPTLTVPQRTWSFTMSPLLFAIGALTVQFYSKKSPGLIVVTYALSVFGLWLLIATRYLYSIDLLSAVIAAVFPFLMYHWYVRNAASISKRPLLLWFENDAIQEWNRRKLEEDARRAKEEAKKAMEEQRQHQRHAQGAAGCPGSLHVTPTSPPPPFTSAAAGAAAGSDSLAVSPLQGNNTATLHAAPLPPVFDVNHLTHFPVSPAVHDADASCVIDFIEPEYGEASVAASGLELTHFGDSPTFIGTEMEAMEDLLVLEAEKMTLNRRRIIKAVSLLLSMAHMGLASFITVSALAFVDARRPIGTVTASDLLFPILPTLPEHTADFFLYSYIAIVALFIFSSQQRLTILRRLFFMWGSLWMMRSATLAVTFPPDPSPICVKREHPPGTTCGDLIFSGHAIGFMLMTYVVIRYVKQLVLQILGVIYASVGLICVVGAKMHYTRDVFTALIVVSCFVHLCQVSIFIRADRKMKYKLLFWFEFDVTDLRLRLRQKAQEQQAQQLQQGAGAGEFPMVATGDGGSTASTTTTAVSVRDGDRAEGLGPAEGDTHDGVASPKTLNQLRQGKSGHPDTSAKTAAEVPPAASVGTSPHSHPTTASPRLHHSPSSSPQLSSAKVPHNESMDSIPPMSPPRLASTVTPPTNFDSRHASISEHPGPVTRRESVSEAELPT